MMLLLDYNQYDPLVENSSQGYEMAGEVGLGGGGGGGGAFGSVCLRCPYCGLEQAAAPVLYYKPSQYHLQLARLILTLSRTQLLTQMICCTLLSFPTHNYYTL